MKWSIFVGLKLRCCKNIVCAGRDQLIWINNSSEPSLFKEPHILHGSKQTDRGNVQKGCKLRAHSFLSGRVWCKLSSGAPGNGHQPVHDGQLQAHCSKCDRLSTRGNPELRGNCACFLNESNSHKMRHDPKMWFISVSQVWCRYPGGFWRYVHLSNQYHGTK